MANWKKELEEARKLLKQIQETIERHSALEAEYWQIAIAPYQDEDVRNMGKKMSKVSGAIVVQKMEDEVRVRSKIQELEQKEYASESR